MRVVIKNDQELAQATWICCPSTSCRNTAKGHHPLPLPLQWLRRLPWLELELLFRVLLSGGRGAPPIDGELQEM